MAEHEKNDSISVRTDEGVVGTVVEVKCGPKYLLVEKGANYCPKCGEEL